MTKTSIMLSGDNWAFWEKLPHGFKGRLINYLMNEARKKLGEFPTHEAQRDFLAELIPDKTGG